MPTVGWQEAPYSFFLLTVILIKGKYFVSKCHPVEGESIQVSLTGTSTISVG